MYWWRDGAWFLCTYLLELTLLPMQRIGRFNKKPGIVSHLCQRHWISWVTQALCISGSSFLNSYYNKCLACFPGDTMSHYIMWLAQSMCSISSSCYYNYHYPPHRLSQPFSSHSAFHWSPGYTWKYICNLGSAF